MGKWTTLLMGAVFLAAGYYVWQLEAKKFPAGPPAPSAPAAGPAAPGEPGAPPAQPSKASSVTSASKIVRYTVAADQSGPVWEETLKLRGLSLSDQVVAADFEELKRIKLLDRMTDAGLAPNGSFKFPVFEVDGKLLTAAGLEAGLSQLPLKNVREVESPYVVVYGPEGCGKTQAGMEELDAAGIPYEYRNVNDSRYRPRFEALTRAYDVRGDWPILDVSGRMMAKPSLEEVRAAYR